MPALQLCALTACALNGKQYTVLAIGGRQLLRRVDRTAVEKTTRRK
jgi:hypothetical protein